jgi:ABC-type phosphate/phosphonate transport system substrate-binding protein
MKKGIQLGLVTVVLCALWSCLLERAESRPPATLTIGAMKSLFRDAPEGLINTFIRPLRGVVEAQAGMPADLKVVTDARGAAEQLEKQELQVAIMHSFEYGWAKQTNPHLRVLVVASQVVRETRFALVVRQDGKVQSVDDLKGTKVALPVMTKEPGHLFLECKCCGGKCADQVFKEVTAPSDGEDALNDVVTRTVQSALVDKPVLDSYLRAKPKQANNLKVLTLSENFPPGVLVYREGHLSEAQLNRFREGLLAAGTNPRTKDLLKLIKLNGFDQPTPAFEAEVEALIKIYPGR